jgi:hypothetical protein
MQVKNKPCVKYAIVMRLIPWIYSRGSETLLIDQLCTYMQCNLNGAVA